MRNKYTSYGGYPTFMVIGYGGNHLEVRCVECTAELENDKDAMEDVEGISAHVNWESFMDCEVCEESIESAYDAVGACVLAHKGGPNYHLHVECANQGGWVIDSGLLDGLGQPCGGCGEVIA